MHQIIVKNSLGTIKSKKLTKAEVDDTLRVIKENASALAYITFEDQNGDKVLMMKTIIQESIFTVVEGA
jgi:hypothetical protein